MKGRNRARTDVLLRAASLTSATSSVSPSAAARNRMALVSRSASCSGIGRCAPASMSPSRDSGLAYIGVVAPVVAFVTRLSRASALRETWVST
jgi:hypothetical protein